MPLLIFTGQNVDVSVLGAIFWPLSDFLLIEAIQFHRNPLDGLELGAHFAAGIEQQLLQSLGKLFDRDGILHRLRIGSREERIARSRRCRIAVDITGSNQTIKKPSLNFHPVASMIIHNSV